MLGSYMLILLDILGSIVLFGLSWHYWNTVQDVYERLSVRDWLELFVMTCKTFLMTMVNPSAILFFLFVSVKLFAFELENMNVWESLFGGFAVMAGTFTALSLVSYVASFVGARLSGERLRKISQTTAVVLGIIATFLLFDAVSLAVRV